MKTDNPLDQQGGKGCECTLEGDSQCGQLCSQSFCQLKKKSPLSGMARKIKREKATQKEGILKSEQTKQLAGFRPPIA